MAQTAPWKQKRGEREAVLVFCFKIPSYARNGNMPIQISHLFISRWDFFFSVELHLRPPPWPWMPLTCKRQSLVPVCKPFPVAAAVESAQVVSWPCFPALAIGDGSECQESLWRGRPPVLNSPSLWFMVPPLWLQQGAPFLWLTPLLSLSSPGWSVTLCAHRPF